MIVIIINSFRFRNLIGLYAFARDSVLSDFVFIPKTYIWLDFATRPVDFKLHRRVFDP